MKLCGTKILFYIVIIFTLINGYGCPIFRFGGFRPYRIEYSRPVFSDFNFKPIDFKPFEIPEFKPISIPHFEPPPELKYSFSHDMDPPTELLFENYKPRLKTFDDRDSLQREILSRPPKTEDGLHVSESKVKSSNTDENVRGKTTRRPNYREMATKDPLSPPLPPSIGHNDYQLQKNGPNYQHYIKKISPQNRILSIDVGYFNRLEYHYTTHDTGTTALGYSLNENLNRWIASPQFNNRNYPRFYYKVRCFYHGNNLVAKKQIIRSDKIVNCYGNSEMICINNTIALCSFDGTLMCVAIETSTVPCVEGDCIKSTISCDNNPAPECEDSKNVTIDVPCISTLTVYGDIDYKNSTITSGEHGNFAMAPNNSTQHYKFTTPKAEAKKRKLSRNFCVGVVLSPTKLPI